MKKHTGMKWTALLLVLLFVVSAFTACGDKKTETGKEPAKQESAGTFTMKDIHGQTITQDIFAQNKLTLVNVMATWCGPCVRELPELQRLADSYADQGVGVIAIVMDTVNSKGQLDEKAMETAKSLSAKAGAKFPMLIPESGALGGKLNAVTSFPTTFVVDSEGNFVGKPFVGGKDLNGWSQVVEKLLAQTEGTTA